MFFRSSHKRKHLWRSRPRESWNFLVFGWKFAFCARPLRYFNEVTRARSACNCMLKTKSCPSLSPSLRRFDECFIFMRPDDGSTIMWNVVKLNMSGARGGGKEKARKNRFRASHCRWCLTRSNELSMSYIWDITLRLHSSSIFHCFIFRRSDDFRFF